jgi:hypothetical protein
MSTLRFLRQYPKVANAFIFLATLLILFSITEWYLRLTGNDATRNEKMGQPYFYFYDAHEKNWYHVLPPVDTFRDDCPEFSNWSTVNNEGLADKIFVQAKPQGSIRIMVIGDSFIQGIGAPNDSSCPRLLESILRDQKEVPRSIEVWNCGVAGSDPIFEYILLAGRLMKYKPDLVIEAINNTDIDDINIRGGAERFRADSTVIYKKAPWFEPLYAKSFLVRRIINSLGKYNWYWLTSAEKKKADANSIGLIESSLSSFKNLCQINHAHLLVAFQPLRGDFDTTKPYVLQPLINFCDSTHIQAIDLKSYMVKEGYNASSITSLYWPLNGHFNSTGYWHYARSLSAPVLEYLAVANFDTVPGNR